MPLVPTAALPSIKSITSTPIHRLYDALKYLQTVYNPPVRGSRRLDSTASREQGAKDSIASDMFERAYALKWLNAILSVGSDITDIDEDALTTLIDDVAAMVAILAGTASAGTFSRQFVFDCQKPPVPAGVSVTIFDTSLDNADYASVGAQTWGGACVLSEWVCKEPKKFGLLSKKPLRILELGAGTGLLSLTLAKLLSRHKGDNTEIEIVATDYYPAVLDNLRRNVKVNADSTFGSKVKVAFLDWSAINMSSSSIDPLLKQPFDLVFGADIIYEPQHAKWIKDCLTQLLSKPDPFATKSHPESAFHLIIPLRETHATESASVENIFMPAEDTSDCTRGEMDLVIKDKEGILCEEEVVYSYFKIGWSDAR